MIAEAAQAQVPVGSPYDLRLSMGEKVSESDMRSAIESGDWGFMHSFTTVSTI